MAQLPAPGQRKPLSTARVESTIPTSADGAWVYPSDQMFYNAMRKKGYEPREEDMRTVVAIHNAVNERTWSAGRAARRRRQPAPRTSPSPSAQERDPALGVAPPRVPGEAAAAALPGDENIALAALCHRVLYRKAVTHLGLLEERAAQQGTGRTRVAS